ncbi:MAG TPA: 50S ribosomal protein L9 [Myxococcaceae bacterium]|nr:50S ribosomal protein L9 [Myxococcaceae bacterium]
MKVILREDVQNLGKSGEIVSVKDGFGRNFLLPRKLAVLANEKNVRQLEHDRSVIAARQAKLKDSAQAEAGQLESVQLKIARKVGEQEKLYGSVTALDIAEALAAQGKRIDRRSIHLPEPIRMLGSHEVEVRLHRDVSAKIRVEVVAE